MVSLFVTFIPFLCQAVVVIVQGTGLTVYGRSCKMHLASIYANLEITFALPLQILIINGVSFLKFPLTANRELDIGGLGAMMKY